MFHNKAIYTDWHRTFPGSGRGKQYPYLLDKILDNHRNHKRSLRQTEKSRTKRWSTILDYGSGKGGTAEWLNGLIKELEIDCYDPGHEQFKDTALKNSYDLVYSCDVLEHIEPEDINTVIGHTQSLSTNNIHIIDMTPAKKHLPCGRNAHVLLLDKYEWIELFETHTHTIEEVFPYSVPDPNFRTRERVCIWTRKTKAYTYTKRSA